MTISLQSIALPAAAPASGSQPGTGVLRARLSRYEAQLADSCNCASSKTADGKRRIAVLQQQADALKAQIEQADSGRRTPPVTAVKANDATNLVPAGPRARIDVYA